MANPKRLAALRFGGGRFETHALSFDALPDLLVYRDLLIDLARHLWLEDHEGRRRTPRRFEEAFPLFLRGVEAGSARAILERDDTDTELGQYLDRASNLVNAVVGAANRDVSDHPALPVEVPAFPASLAKHFNRFGRKLRADEWVELQVHETEGPRYTAAIGRRITLAYMGRYEEEIVLAGELGGLDVNRAKVSIKTADGEIVDVPSCSPEVVSAAVSLLLRPVQLTVVAEFNRSGVRERVKEGRDIRPLREDDAREGAPLAEQFERLRSLPPGWFEASTPALDRQGLAQFQSFLEQVVAHAQCARPFLYPTEDGGARAEWTLGPWEVAVIADLTTPDAVVHATNVQANDTKELSLSLSRPADALQLAHFLRQFPPLENVDA